jgi:hypothetical protein
MSHDTFHWLKARDLFKKELQVVIANKSKEVRIEKSDPSVNIMVSLAFDKSSDALKFLQQSHSSCQLVIGLT